jgi:predicted MFS family arabinose efflux permease
MMKGILVFQLATGVLLALTGLSTVPLWCAVFFCAYSAAQWICSPALYTLLMNNMAEDDRAGASALIMFSNSLLTAVATPAAGILLLHFGYPAVMVSMAVLICLLAITFYWLISQRSPAPAPAPLRAESFTD